MITSPQLPPKVGYTEIEVDGVRQYTATSETLTKLQRDAELQFENVMLRAQVTALTDRNEFTEDCIAEMAMKIYQ